MIELREGTNVIAGPLLAQRTADFSHWLEVRRALVVRIYAHTVGMDLDYVDWGYMLTVRFGPDWSDWWYGWVSDTHPWDIFTEAWFQQAHEHFAAGFPAADPEVVTFLQELGLELLEAAEEGREVVL